MVPAERINRTSATSRKIGRNTRVSLQNMGIHPPKQVTKQSPSPLKTCKLNTPTAIWETRLASTIHAKEALDKGWREREQKLLISSPKPKLLPISCLKIQGLEPKGWQP